MSIIDHLTIKAESAKKLASVGISLANSLYKRPLLILFRGELGAGKTTFIQGLAGGLGVKAKVVSPTYALEQRYGQTLSHIDLYRLSGTQAKEFVRDLEEFEGVRAIEWAERESAMKGDINISIGEDSTGGRVINIECRDIKIPGEADIAKWQKEVHLPSHIAAHTKAVADLSMKIADYLTGRGTVVRKKALYAAALMHDLLRFVDFKSWGASDAYTPTDADRKVWTAMKEKYGTPHETAAEKFLVAHGYPEVGFIVRPHRGFDLDLMQPLPLLTTEQIVLCYADKRVNLDKVVTVDERFDDFMVRYSHGQEAAPGKAWREHMKRVEAELFPEGVPF